MPTKVNHTCGKLEPLDPVYFFTTYNLLILKGEETHLLSNYGLSEGSVHCPNPRTPSRGAGVKAVQFGAAPWCGLGHIYKLQPCLTSSKEHMELWILMLDLRYMKPFSRAVQALNMNRLKEEKWHTVDFR